jgi:hypothetical protein
MNQTGHRSAQMLHSREPIPGEQRGEVGIITNRHAFPVRRAKSEELEELPSAGPPKLGIPFRLLAQLRVGDVSLE